MKRIICLTLILAMLISAGAALGENGHCGIRAGILAGGTESEIRGDLYWEETAQQITAYMTTSLLPNAYISVEELADQSLILRMPWGLLSDGDVWDAIGDCARKWIGFLGPETREGVYSGDTFEIAYSMERVTFSWGDLGLLWNSIRRELQALYPDAGIPDVSLEKLFMPERNARFELKIFDGGQYYSLNVLNGTDTVMTVSVNLAEPDYLRAVIGFGAEKKNYYAQILAVKTAGGTDAELKLLADDRRAGYPALGEESLILTHMMRIVPDDEKTGSLTASGSMIPANGLTPITWNGTVNAGKQGEVFSGRIGFAEESLPQAEISVTLDSSLLEEKPAREVSISAAGEQELITLGTELSFSLLPVMIRVLENLPAEYAAPLLNILFPTGQNS